MTPQAAASAIATYRDERDRAAGRRAARDRGLMEDAKLAYEALLESHRPKPGRPKGQKAPPPACGAPGVNNAASPDMRGGGGVAPRQASSEAVAPEATAAVPAAAVRPAAKKKRAPAVATACPPARPVSVARSQLLPVSTPDEVTERRRAARAAAKPVPRGKSAEYGRKGWETRVERAGGEEALRAEISATMRRVHDRRRAERRGEVFPDDNTNHTNEEAGK